MAYATTQNLIDRYGEIEIARLSTAEGASTVAVDPARCQAALDSATAQAESYLRAQVVVPMTSPPLAVVDHVCALARYYLAHGGGREPTTQMKTLRDEAIAWLRCVARGEVQLSDTVPSAGAQGGRFSDRGRVLSTDTLAGYI